MQFKLKNKNKNNEINTDSDERDGDSEYIPMHYFLHNEWKKKLLFRLNLILNTILFHWDGWWNISLFCSRFVIGIFLLLLIRLVFLKEEFKKRIGVTDDSI